MEYQPEKHVLLTDNNNVMMDEDGNVMVYDTELKMVVALTGHSIVEMPIETNGLTLDQNSTSGIGTEKSKGSKMHPSSSTVVNNNTCQAGSSKELPKKWVVDEAIHLLLDLWKSHELQFKEGRLWHEVIWLTISNAMKEAGYNYSRTQCEDKFKDLRKQYMRIKDHNSQTGAEPKSWKFFGRFEQLFGEKPNVKPVSLASNRKRRVLDCDSDSEEYLSEDGGKNKARKEIAEKKRKTRMSKVDKQMKAWAEVLREQNNEKREDQNRRHAENQGMMNRMLEANTQFFEKLLEKL